MEAQRVTPGGDAAGRWVNMSFDPDLVPRRLTRDEARKEPLRFWAGKTVAERLDAMTELTRRLYRMRGIDVDQFKTDFTPGRIRRSKR